MLRDPAGRAEMDRLAQTTEGQLRAIVGLELQITRIEAKAKLSQNRSDEDHAGVVDRLGNDWRHGVSQIGRHIGEHRAGADGEDGAARGNDGSQRRDDRQKRSRARPCAAGTGSTRPPTSPGRPPGWCARYRERRPPE